MYPNLPIIDLELSTSLLGDKDEAKKMFNLFLQLLPEAQTMIEQYYQTQDWQGLAAEIDKLLSGACYCGVPRLQKAARELHIVLDGILRVDQYYARLSPLSRSYSMTLLNQSL